MQKKFAAVVAALIFFSCSPKPPTQVDVKDGTGAVTKIPLEVDELWLWDQLPLMLGPSEDEGRSARIQFVPQTVESLERTLNSKLKNRGTWTPLRMSIQTIREHCYCAMIQGMAKNGLGVETQVTTYLRRCISEGKERLNVSDVVERHLSKCPR